jgi:hypothetical protein
MGNWFGAGIMHCDRHRLFAGLAKGAENQHQDLVDGKIPLKKFLN